eukprot:COSAG05_NODE_584_length_8527_cov_46.366279_12_plen_82_part_00
MQWQIFSIFFLTLTIWLSASCAPWHTWITLAAWPREQNVSVLSPPALPDATDPVGFGSSFTWLIPAPSATVPSALQQPPSS